MTTIWTISAVINSGRKDADMTEVLAHLDVNTETLVPDLREAIVIDDLEVTEEMVAVVTEAVIGILPHADIPICRHQIKECEAAIGKSKN